MDWLGGWWELIRAGLLAAWMVAALFWAVAGIATASWARVNPVAGGIIGAATMFVGCGAILFYGAVRTGSMAVTGNPAGARFPPDPDADQPSPYQRGTFGAGGLNGPNPYPSSEFGSPTGPTTGGFGTPNPYPSSSFGTGGFGTPNPYPSSSFGTGGFGTPNPPPVLGAGPAVPAPTNSGMFRAVILALAGVITAGFLAAAFTPWVSFGFGLEIDGSDVALVPLMSTSVVVGLCAASCWRGPRRLPAVVIAWFSSWWMLLGILALSEGGYLADSVSSLSAQAVASLELDEQYARTASVTLGDGVTLVALAGLAGFAWATVAVVRRAVGVTRWS